MLLLIVAAVLLVAGLWALSRSADVLVDNAARLAVMWRISHFTIGAIIIGFGTSLPEVVVSISAAIWNKPSLPLGNVLGSNIANVLLAFGITLLLFPVGRLASFRRDFCWLAAATAVVTALLLRTDTISRIDGIMLILVLGAFLFDAFHRGDNNATLHDNSDHDNVATDTPPPPQTTHTVLMVVVMLICVLVSAQAVLWSATTIAQFLGISDFLIGLTVIAVGTSLPEIMTTIAAARRGRPDMAVGNIIGSNIINLLLGLSLPALIRPLPFAAYMYDDLLMMLATTVVFWLLVSMRLPGRWQRFMGGSCLVVYAAYIVVQVLSGSG